MPLTYTISGKQIYVVDMQTGHEQDVLRFPSPDELWNQTFAEANQWRDRFNSVPFEDVGGAFFITTEARGIIKKTRLTMCWRR